MEDMEANNNSLLDVSLDGQAIFPAVLPLTQKLPVNKEMLKNAALDSRYKMGTVE